ncbi:MAG: hypothetical protein HON70_30770, partial [Lentisphaerae bacterium]|nr:hypothetical protein [Lentisphaerota bacterium]
TSLDAAGLIQLCRRVRGDFTERLLRGVTDSEAPIQDGPRTLTASGVLMHLIWHWTYHSGQTGLLRMQADCDYDWALHPRFTGFTDE